YRSFFRDWEPSPCNKCRWPRRDARSHAAHRRQRPAGRACRCNGRSNHFLRRQGLWPILPWRIAWHHPLGNAQRSRARRTNNFLACKKPAPAHRVPRGSWGRMMLRLVRLFLAGTLGLIAAPAWAETRDEADARVLEEAFEALSAKEYEPAIAKTGEIIARFEAERRANARYGCSAGPGDPPAAVEGATVIPILQLICTAYFLRGYALVDIGRRDEAGPDLEAAAAMDPDNDQFAAELGEWYKTQRQWEKSLEIFTRASQLIDRSLELEIEDKAEVQSIRNARRCRS